MPPHDGLTHLKEYDIKDSNVELIGTNIDHNVKYASAATEPAWNNGIIGNTAGLFVWRIENFEVVPWPRNRIGQFYDGDSYIVLHSYEIGKEGRSKKLAHDIFFWLGSKTTTDEAGTAAYKTVELDEFLKGMASQHREVQSASSEEFMSLFPLMRVLRGGVRSGFRHVEQEEGKEDIKSLLRVFKPASAKGIVVHEVQPTWQSLDEDDVFVLDTGIKIWVWQGKKCSPMEKAKAARIVHDMTLAKHIDVEVLSQLESRSVVFVDMLGGKGERDFQCPKPLSSSQSASRPCRLLRLSDASGQLTFDLLKDGQSVRGSDFDSADVYVFDTGKAIWVWKGLGASQTEKALWIRVAQTYANKLQDSHLAPIASVVEGNESPAFLKALEA